VLERPRRQVCEAIEVARYEYTIKGEVRTVEADGHRTNAEETVFVEQYRSGEKTERVVLAVRADERSVKRISP